MPKIAILGSCMNEPYEVLFMPNKLDPKLYDENHEEAYRQACDVVYPKIEEADLVIVYAPDGLGEHTTRDIIYALKAGKKPYIVGG